MCKMQLEVLLDQTAWQVISSNRGEQPATYLITKHNLQLYPNLGHSLQLHSAVKPCLRHCLNIKSSQGHIQLEST